MLPLKGKDGRVALAAARQGEENDEQQDGENEDALFRAGGTAGERVQEIAAAEVLLEQSDDQQTHESECAEAEDGRYQRVIRAGDAPIGIFTSLVRYAVSFIAADV